MYHARCTCRAIALVLLAGCYATPSRQATFTALQTDIHQRIGGDLSWGVPSLDAAMRTILAGPLTADQAVQIALLNNHHLQASFEEIGIAHADLLQAGLLKNPVFDLSVRVPDRRPSRTYLDISVAESFLDVLWIPARRKIAEAQFAQTQSKVTHEVLTLAARTRSAYYASQGASQLVELRQSILDATSASAEAAQKLHEAGNITDLELLTQQSQASRAKIDLMSAQADAQVAHEKLRGLLGLDQDFKTAIHLPDLPAEEIEVRGLEDRAVRQRADLAAARSEVLAMGRAAGLADQTRFFGATDLGPEAERETDGQWRIGPTITVPVPLFDQGQAVVSKAHSLLRQSQERYAAMVFDIRSEVRAAGIKMLAARSKAIFYRDELLPLQQKVLQQTQLQFNGMYVGVFQLLQAKRDQIDAAREYLESLRDYWMARCELEMAVGAKVANPKSE